MRIRGQFRWTSSLGLRLTVKIEQYTDLWRSIQQVDTFGTVHATITAVETTAYFVDTAFCHHELPENIVSYRDPRYTAAF